MVQIENVSPVSKIYIDCLLSTVVIILSHFGNGTITLTRFMYIFTSEDFWPSTNGDICCLGDVWPTQQRGWDWWLFPGLKVGVDGLNKISLRLEYDLEKQMTRDTQLNKVFGWAWFLGPFVAEYGRARHRISLFCQVEEMALREAGSWSNGLMF